MNAISKKLFSLLVVIAMVLSLVPFGGLSIFAVETKAAAVTAQEAADIITAANAMDFSDPENLPDYCPACGVTSGVEWQPIVGTNGWRIGYNGSGHYYAEKDVTQVAGVDYFAHTASTLCIHLNGNAITYGSRILSSTNGVLNVMAGDGGTVNYVAGTDNAASAPAALQAYGGELNVYGGTYTTADSARPVMRVEENGTANVYGATIDGNNTSKGIYVLKGNLNLKNATVRNGSAATPGANIQVATGKVTMDGGSIQGGTSNAWPGGGSVYVSASGEFTLNSGTVSGGTTTASGSGVGGGNVHVYGGTFTMNGGEILDGSANTDGDNVYVSTNGKFYLKGGEIGVKETAARGDLYLHKGTVEISGGKLYALGVSTADTSCTITGGKFRQEYADYLAAGYEFQSKTDGVYTYEVAEKAPVVQPELPTTCPGCNATGVTWTEIGTATGNRVGDTKTGHYYVPQGGVTFVNNTTEFANSKGGTLCIHLNGQELKYSGRIMASGTTAVVNVIGTGGGKVTHVPYSGNGASCAFMSYNGGKLNLIDGTYTTEDASRPLVYVNWKGETTISDAIIDGNNIALSIKIDSNQNVLNLNNATVQNGKNATGGNIYATGSATITMTGGSITDGNATGNGGNIYLTSANTKFIMNSGSISGGVAGSEASGGNVYVDLGAEMNVAGGTVTGGQAKTGGNIYVNGSKLKIAGDITNGTAYYYGNIYANNSTVEMTGGSISGGILTSGGYYENIALAGTSEMTWSGGIITPGTGSMSGLTMLGTSTLTLDGDATAINSSYYGVRLDGTAKLVVEDTWTGEVGLFVANFTAEVGDVISRCSCTGAYTGTLMHGRTAKLPIVKGADLVEGTENYELVLTGYGVVDISGTTDVTTWMTLSEAVAAANGRTDKYLLAAADITLNNNEVVFVDATADISINVGSNGTVYGIDPANADFTTESTGMITDLSGNGVLKSDAIFDGMRYIKTPDGSFHAIEMGITGVTLRPSAIGLYYRAAFKCDAVLAENISAFGVVLSVHDMPGADFVTDPTDQFTVVDTFGELYNTETNSVSANSGSVFGIMKSTKSAADNAEHGVTKIYANAYIQVGNTAIYVGDTENAGQKAGTALSLYDVMLKVDEKWADLELTDTNIQQINDLYTKCKEYGEVTWTFENIGK